MVPESRDIATFAAEELSGDHKLLPAEGAEGRAGVLEMLDLHGTLPIEPLTQVRFAQESHDKSFTNFFG